MVLKLNHDKKITWEAFGLDEKYNEKLMEFFRKNQGLQISKLIEAVWSNAPNDNERAYGIFVIGNLSGANHLAEKLLKEKPK